MSAAGTYTDGAGRTYPIALSKTEYETERAKADEIHVVKRQTDTSGDW